MKDRQFLVTGSSSGIGRAISEKLLDRGATVIGIARSHQKFQPNTKRYKAIKTDLSNFETLPAVLKEIISDHPHFDGFVSNAGYGQFAPLENFSLEQISSYINVNLISHVMMAKMIIPHFKANKRGDIVIIGSESSLQGAKKGSLYCAAKFGLRGFSQAIREECASRNVRVSIINPGMVRTPFFDNLSFSPGSDSSNAIEPEDVASAAISIFSARIGTVIDEINLTPLRKVINFDVQ